MGIFDATVNHEVYMPIERIAVYIDGFNLYHALDALNAPALKWVNLRRLSDLLIARKNQKIVKVAYFSAYAHHFQNTPFEGRLRRHRAYVAALKAKNVYVRLGNFAKRSLDYKAKGFKASWTRREEKQTDVAIGVQVMRDAYCDVFDAAYIVSCDTDLVPVFEMGTATFPQKRFVTVAPPGRAHHQKLLDIATDHLVIKRSQIEKALFGPRVISGGKVVAIRPPSYRP
jgi:uncharacterized LabA/DUF88 family protein